MTALPYDYEEDEEECQCHKGLDDAGEYSHNNEESELGAGIQLMEEGVRVDVL